MKILNIFILKNNFMYADRSSGLKSSSLIGLIKQKIFSPYKINPGGIIRLFPNLFDKSGILA